MSERKFVTYSYTDGTDCKNKYKSKIDTILSTVDSIYNILTDPLIVHIDEVGKNGFKNSPTRH